jgi:hypothetical protein
MAAARKAGMKFMERATDGAFIVEGLDQLALIERQKLQAQWDDVRCELLPDDISTASRDLLASLDIELLYIDTEGRAPPSYSAYAHREGSWARSGDCTSAGVSSDSVADSRHQGR